MQSLIEKIFFFVADKSSGVFINEIGEHVFNIKNISDDNIINVFLPLIEQDKRFKTFDENRVGLSENGIRYKELMETEFTVVDTETTGTNSKTDRITEIGCVKIKGYTILNTFETLINPGRYIPENIIKMTGITNEMVLNAPKIDTVIDRFLEFINDSVFVAHNVSFDLKFINKELQLTKGISLNNEKLCTVKLARKLLPGLNGKNLDSLAKHFNIKRSHRHRAGGDALITAHVLFHLWRIVQEREIFSLEDLLNI